ncbi:uncharacterized protein LOC119359620 [Triticum dicoccoides]|uniref:uncharacterized protein LOC119359620 n=1 Tax=Triticum dicoccoides TaxID=85692 RepID=UPI00188F0489|nr:uncharacterized protein LOC119359620 [Triticum dicoccoides]XP_044453414.1 uncharacterized protein LOC123185627 [Triticum aestivum]
MDVLTQELAVDRARCRQPPESVAAAKYLAGERCPAPGTARLRRRCRSEPLVPLLFLFFRRREQQRLVLLLALTAHGLAWATPPAPLDPAQQRPGLLPLRLGPRPLGSQER